MIKIILEINEIKNKRYNETKATLCHLDIDEIKINETYSEKRMSDIIKERIGVEQKVQIINESSDRDIANKILNDLGL